MNKKVKKKKEVKHDGTEDLDIKKVAHSNTREYALYIILIILFGFTFYSALVYIGKYYNNKKEQELYSEVIKINKNDDRIVISNNGELNKVLSVEDDNNAEDIVIENVDLIEITSKDIKNINTYLFDVRYNILENEFPKNVVATNDSNILVRFAYSYDQENWNYIDNAISINDNNMKPLIGGLYDLSGVIGNIKVATNFQIKSNPYEPVKVYWKSETIMKYNNDNLGKKIKADFKISYSDDN